MFFVSTSPVAMFALGTSTRWSPFTILERPANVAQGAIHGSRSSMGQRSHVHFYLCGSKGEDGKNHATHYESLNVAMK